ncbi:sigma-70 family RNA polymerase sigma factor [Candidatus Uhrbacteria bacterium]|nr:sigma-70 family RNA polymerase sigma factor [Candidatus Uhrbacteria bacterium]
MRKFRLLYMSETTNHSHDGLDFEVFFREQLRPLERYIAMRVRPTEDVRDLAAEIACQFLEYCRRSDVTVRQHRALLYKIARNRIADYYGQAKEQRREIALEDAPPIRTPGSLPVHLDARRDLQRTMEALDAIHADYRDVLLLHGNVGLSISELAELLGKNVVAVRVLLHRARRALKEELRRRGALDGVSDDAEVTTPHPSHAEHY